MPLLQNVFVFHRTACPGLLPWEEKLNSGAAEIPQAPQSTLATL